MKSQLVEFPSEDQARRYVRKGIYEKGGWGEAVRGLYCKTIPMLLGFESSLTPSRIVGLLLRGLIVLLTAAYPLIMRKALTGNIPEASSLPEGISSIWQLVRTAGIVDYILGAIALGILVTPKIGDTIQRQRKQNASPHSPYYALSAAIRKMPNGPEPGPGSCNESIQLALNALRDEMLMLTGDEGRQRVTDVTLLVFCGSDGSQMKVHCRTANHEETGRPVESKRLVAYYVAMAGRNFIEHDFHRRENPFPRIRLSVQGQPPAAYRSVLYLPLIHSRQVLGLGEKPELVEDYCVGVICVHSSKPYRFWRWGDHRKSQSGFVNVASGRCLPYIDLCSKLLLASNAHQLRIGAPDERRD